MIIAGLQPSDLAKLRLSGHGGGQGSVVGAVIPPGLASQNANGPLVHHERPDVVLPSVAPPSSVAQTPTPAGKADAIKQQLVAKAFHFDIHV